MAMKLKALIFCGLLSASLLQGITPAQAATEAHCLVRTDGMDEKKNLIVKSSTCYSDFGSVLKSLGVSKISDASISNRSLNSSLLDYVIGVHYDGTGGSGSSLTITGSNCLGGGLPMTGSWNDKISSTLNGCGTITHYEHIDYSGGTYQTFGFGTHNISGYMNNKTSAITYSQ